MYDGAPLLKSSNNNVIWVAPNYRLGAYGFLAGPTVEAQGLPNAGFHDQKKALEWVQKYISLVGGDKKTVTAMGESAGAGSIMHHLIGNGGTSDPLFRRAILQSPAFEPQYSPTKLLAQYSQFESVAGCAGKGLSCLRTKTTAELQTANLAVVGSVQYGTFGFGPAVDNSYIRDLPGIEMANGNYWKDMTIMFGHNSEEGHIFTDPSKILNRDVDNLLKYNFPNITTANFNKLVDLYPHASIFGTFTTTFNRLSQTIGDWICSCNTRYLAKAYAGKAYGYVVSIPPGIHAVDLPLTFWRTDLNIYNLIQIDLDLNFLTSKNIATGFQSYFTSFARSGNPNTYREKGGFPATIDMVQSTVGDTVKVVNVKILSYSIDQDEDQSKDRCDFWQSGVWTGR